MVSARARWLARTYLRLRRRSTVVFDESIFPTTPRAVIAELRKAGFEDARDANLDELDRRFRDRRFNMPGRSDGRLWLEVVKDDARRRTVRLDARRDRGEPPVVFYLDIALLVDRRHGDRARRRRGPCG